MLIDRDRLLDIIREGGDAEAVRVAEAELPDPVDSERDHDLLTRFGIDPQQLGSALDGSLPGARGTRGVIGGTEDPA